MMGPSNGGASAASEEGAPGSVLPSRSRRRLDMPKVGSMRAVPVFVLAATLMTVPTVAVAQSSSLAPSTAPAGSCPSAQPTAEAAPSAAAAASAAAGVRRFSADAFDVDLVIPDGWTVGVDARNALQLIGPDESVYVNLAQLDAPIDPDDPEG